MPIRRASTTAGSPNRYRRRLMLPILTGMIVGGLRVLAIPRHVHALAPRAVLFPPRGGTTGGYWGMAHGLVVLALGLVVLTARRLFDVDTPVLRGGFSVGALLVVVGLVAAYRVSILETHDHPHTHDGREHSHVHIHRPGEQVHDHDQPDFEIVDGVFTVSNLAAAVPAFALSELDAVLYLVTYLVTSTLATGGLGYWLGYSRRRRAGDRVLRLAGGIGYSTTLVGVTWAVVWWPF